MIRAQPMDAVVLVGGCDKTVPALLMGAASADVPAVQLIGGPMLPMDYHGERLGACTDCRRFWAKYRAKEVSDRGDRSHRGQSRDHRRKLRGDGHRQHHGLDCRGARHDAARHRGHSRRPRRSPARRGGERTPGGGDDRHRPAAEPDHHRAVDRERAARAAGDRRLDQCARSISPPSPAASASNVSLERLNALSDETPILVDLKPTGQHYMSDLFAAGGIGAVMRELKPLLHLDVMTVTGETPGRAPRRRSALGRPQGGPPAGRSLPEVRRAGGAVRLARAQRRHHQALRRRPAPVRARGPRGGVHLPRRSRRAHRFPDLDVTPDDFLVLQNAGPKSGYAMPEAGYLPIPGKLARAGVKDMVRISDARMSGTAYGTIVLHVSPEVRGRRSARLRAQRRPHRAFGGQPLARPQGRRRRDSPSAARRTARPRMKACGAMPGSTCRACCRPRRGAILIFCGRGEERWRTGTHGFIRHPCRQGAPQSRPPYKTRSIVTCLS